jgi:hypothetical protein
MGSSISITVSDKRNNSYIVTIPFIRYSKPELKLESVEGNYIYQDNTYIIFGKVTFKLKAISVIGLSAIKYKIDDQQEQVINLNGEKEYTFNITIE